MILLSLKFNPILPRNFLLWDNASQILGWLNQMIIFIGNQLIRKGDDWQNKLFVHQIWSTFQVAWCAVIKIFLLILARLQLNIDWWCSNLLLMNLSTRLGTSHLLLIVLPVLLTARCWCVIAADTTLIWVVIVNQLGFLIRCTEEVKREILL